MSSDNNEGYFECSNCNIEFDSKDSLLLHLTEDHDNETGVCQFCDKEIDDPRAYLDHLNKPHPFDCIFCSKTFTTIRQMDRHIETCSQAESPSIETITISSDSDSSPSHDTFPITPPTSPSYSPPTKKAKQSEPAQVPPSPSVPIPLSIPFATPGTVMCIKCKKIHKEGLLVNRCGCVYCNTCYHDWVQHNRQCFLCKTVFNSFPYHLKSV